MTLTACGLRLRDGWLAVALLVLPVVAAPADACSCAQMPFTCQNASPSGSELHAVFVGTVLDIAAVQERIAEPGPVVISEYRVRLRVDEDFARLGVREIEVRTPGNSAMCGYTFTTGTRYLVYAGRSSVNEGFDVSLCSRTTPVESAPDEVAVLRALHSGKRESRIFGNVRVVTRDARLAGDRGGLRVVASSNGGQFETVTDAQGQFRFLDLPHGHYRLRAWLDDSLSTESRIVPILSESNSCAEIDFLFQLPGRR